MTVYTVGHSNLEMGEFLSLLSEHGIGCIVDVRSSPYSRYAPHFSKDALGRALARAGIQYVFEGAALGGRPDAPECYRKRAVPQEDCDYLAEVDYAAVMQKAWFREGIERLLRTAAEVPTAILCSEADPKQCHRHHLLAAYLLRNHADVRVLHVLTAGTFDAASLGSVADDPTVVQPSLF